jgi:outer membrane protein assembly factor BamB
MRKYISISLVFAVVCAFFSFTGVTLSSNNEASDWSSFQKDALRRGQAYYSERLTNPLAVAWESKLSEALMGTIIIGKDIAVAQTVGGKIAGFSLSDGSRLWLRDLKAVPTTDLTLNDEIVLVCLKGGKLLGLDLYTGGTFWEIQVRNNSDVLAAPFPYFGYFYIVSSDGLLMVIPSASGQIMLQNDIKTKALVAPTVLPMGYANNNSTSVLIPTQEKFISSFNTMTKDFDFQYELPKPMSQPIIQAGEVYIVTLNDGTVQGVSLINKKPYWTAELNKPVSAASCLFSSTSFVAVGHTDGTVSAIRIGDGSVIWQSKTAGAIKQGLVGIDQNVVLVTENGHVQVLFGFDGTVVTDVNLESKITTPPSYSGGALFVGTESGKLVCLKPRVGTMRLTLDPQILVVSPSETKNVTINFSSREGDQAQYLLTNSGFPCRCKVDRRFLPDSNIKPSEKKSLEIKVAPDAEPATYEYLVTTLNPSDQNVRVSATGIIIVAKPDELVKSTLTADTSKPGKLFVKITFDNSKYLKTFSGKVVFDPAILKPASVKYSNETLENTSYADLTELGFIPFAYSYDTKSGKYPNANTDTAIFEFDIIKSGKTKIDYSPNSRSQNGTVLPCLPASTEVEVAYKAVEHTVVLQIGYNVAYVDGKEEKLAVAPYILAGKTMVPLRFIGSALGSKVEWDGKDKSVLYTNSLRTGARTIKLWIGKKVALIDGKESEVSPPPEIKSGNTCVGLSFVSRNFGAEVSYTASTKTVTIKYKN